MKKKKQDIDNPAVQARKLNPIVKPNPNCDFCKGKGIGDPIRRAIVACPKCKTNISESPVLPVIEKVDEVIEEIKPVKEAKKFDEKKFNKKVGK